MTERSELLGTISTTISDYRSGEIVKPTPEHVNRWVSQFERSTQIPLLREMAFVLDNTYYSRNDVAMWLQGVITLPKLAGRQPASFWSSSTLLDIQGGGNSQREFNSLVTDLLRETYDTHPNARSSSQKSDKYIYLDDAVFTGNRLSSDIKNWLNDTAPAKSELYIIAIALYHYGWYRAELQIKEAAKAAGKEIKLFWYRAILLEDRRAYTDSSDVLKPVVIPQSPVVTAYVDAMKYKPRLRLPGNIGANALYSGEPGKQLLEQEFLITGAHIRNVCVYLGTYQRPLGNMTLESLGFGSLIVTYRNCPNNAPLALWAGDPWYPLFPRKTNVKT